MNPEIIKDYFTKRLNRIIIDFLLRENRFASAKAYIEETGLKVSSKYSSLRYQNLTALQIGFL